MSVKWKIYPRQYGKTYELKKWWLEDPENRVILVESTVMAKERHYELKEALAEVRPDNTFHQNRVLLQTHIVSWRTWRNNARTSAEKKMEVAIDGLDYILPALFKGTNIVYAAGAGTNDIPDPTHEAYVAEFHRRWREQYDDWGIDGN